MGRAACVIVFNEDRTKVLSVSRKGDPTDVGFPGGKVEDGETFERAAARELEEETGLVADELKFVYMDDDGLGFVTACFEARVFGEIDTDEEGVVRWVVPKTLLRGSFANYNERVFAALGLRV